MNVRKEMIKREIAGEYFLIPVGRTVYDTNGLFALTEVGAFLWDRLPEARDAEALVQAVLAEYEVDADTAAADITAFLEKLHKLEIL